MRRFLLRLAWLAIFLCVPVQTAALAAEPAKPLTVQAVFEGQLPLAGMRFNVYRVADRSGGGSFPKPLTAEEERIYLKRSAEGDLEARNILIERNLRLVAHIMNKG